MEQLIASYLFQQRSCPLPGMGVLQLGVTDAVTDFTNKTIAAPAPVIRFKTVEQPVEAFLKYIAERTNSNAYEAAEALDHFCDQLKKAISSSGLARIEGIGEFVVNGSSETEFRPFSLTDAFLPAVPAVRVVHPDAEHQIRVGDKETTNTVMTDYYLEVPVKKDRWWIWAIVLAALAIVAILVYFSEMDNSSTFGNAIKI